MPGSRNRTDSPPLGAHPGPAVTRSIGHRLRELADEHGSRKIDRRLLGVRAAELAAFSSGKLP